MMFIATGAIRYLEGVTGRIAFTTAGATIVCSLGRQPFHLVAITNNIDALDQSCQLVRHYSTFALSTTQNNRNETR